MKSIKFSKDEIAALGGPAVYIFRSGRHMVYVGSSAYGLGRALGPNHKMRHVEGDFSLELIPCATADEAFDLEQTLIRQNDPKYNCHVTTESIAGRKHLEELREAARLEEKY